MADACLGAPPKQPRPPITWRMVVTAVRRTRLPTSTVHTQPAGKTLIDFDTIFYTHAGDFDRSLTLLGQHVEVSASPVGYLWHHGDGTTASSTVPGAPYPSEDIVYDYAHAHVTVQTSVDVSYQARFRVDGGRWRPIPQQITIPGPATGLRISEATTVLSGH